MVTKNKLKDIFHQHNVQLTVDAINMIDDEIRRSIVKMAKRCQEGNVKRLNTDLMWIALGRNYNNYV